MVKCKKCGAPLEGFLYNTIGKLMGLKPSEKDPELCNKCSDEEGEVVKPVEPAVSEPEEKVAAAEQAVEAKSEPAEEEEKKEDNFSV